MQIFSGKRNLRDKYVPIFTLLCSFVTKSSQGKYPIPYALSPVYLQYLEDVETRIYQFLKNRAPVPIDSDKQGIVQRYVLEYEDNIQISKNLSNHYHKYNDTADFSHDNYVSGESYVVASNPILSLQMINRFVKYMTNSNIYTAVFDEGIIEKGALPSANEVEDAMEALLRLHYFYDLDAHQLAHGILQGTHTNARLSARECFELGKFSQESGFFTLALQWFDVVLHKLMNTKLEEDPSLTGLRKEAVIQAIKDTVKEHNQDYEENLEEGDMYSFSTPIYSTNYSSIAHLSLRKRLPEKFTGKWFTEGSSNYYKAIESNMMALCEGKNLQPENVRVKLKCYLDTSRHAYWKINPLKIEVLSDVPKIIQMYDIVSDTWISYLKNVSYSELQRAPQPPEATPRTAAYAWLEDAVIPDIPVSKTVEFITGLNVVGKKAAEELQVAAYAFGGHVAPHHDSFDLGESEEAVYNATGSQVSTFLIYLNEVEKGGLTAFPLAGVSIKPVKNSAVLWYTKLKNGEVDNKTLHAACPVIKGHKWIATKWPRIAENILKRPCGLTPDE